MWVQFVKAGCVLLGGLLGLLLNGRLTEKHTRTITVALGIATLIIGIGSALESADILCTILSLVAGTILGQLLKIEQRMDGLGDWLKSRLAKNGGGQFTEGFVTASLLFCVGSMSIMGSLETGTTGNGAIILSKTALDAVMAVTFAAAMGVGVLFSAAIILVYQGAITLLAAYVTPFLSAEVVTCMNGVGGVLLIGTAFNIIGLTRERVRVGDMLPSLFVPILYLPLKALLAGLI